MKHEISDLLRLQARVVQRPLDGGRNRRHRKAVDLLPVHVHIIHDLLLFSQRIVVFAVHAQERASLLSVAALVISQDPRFRRFKHRRSRAVSEQHAGAPVAPVHDPGKAFRPQHQSLPEPSRLKEGVRRLNGKQKTGTGSVDVKGHRMIRAQPRLQLAGGGRGHMVRRNGPHHDQIQILSRDAGLRKRLHRSLIRHVRRRHLLCQMSFPDPRPGPDPFVRCIHNPGKPVVGHAHVRQTAPRSRYSARHFLSSCRQRRHFIHRKKTTGFLPPLLFQANSAIMSFTCSIFRARHALLPQKISPLSTSPFTAFTRASVMQ